VKVTGLILNQAEQILTAEQTLAKNRCVIAYVIVTNNIALRR
jgi:hypothetical protein